MKIITTIFLVLLFLTIIVQTTTGVINFPVADEQLNTPLIANIPASPIKDTEGILGVIALIAQYIYAIFFIIAVAFILFAAFNYLSAGDDPEKIKTAHKRLTYAAIAIAVALLAVGASLIIKTFLKSGQAM